MLAAAGARAHTVPSMTIEAEFAADHTYVLRINLDPRLFLSTDPAKLPPVEASWWRDQTAEQRKATERKAADYVKRAITLLFAGKATELPVLTFTPMDGATNSAFTADTKEVHLLAEAHDKTDAPDSQIALGREANTSLILLNSYAGNPERRPQVLFPGETSRVFVLRGK